MKRRTLSLLTLICALCLAGCAASTEQSGGETAAVLESPPALTISSGGGQVEGLLGSYSWRRQNPDGTAADTEACGDHPLAYQALYTPLETGETAATLQFQTPPDAILSTNCWSDAYWGDPSAEGQAAAVSGDQIALRSGGYVYEIVAEWDASGDCGGTAHYFFYVQAP